MPIIKDLQEALKTRKLSKPADALQAAAGQRVR